ncbi:MAG: sulfurtransferase [Dehalococcoidia bacterium]
MAVFVSADWVEERLDSPDVQILDPRRPVKYLQGHIRNAVNLPVAKAFSSEGELLADEALQRWLGAAGLGGGKTPIVYDAYDGQSGAMLAWILEYLGCTDVHLMDVFFEKWVAEGRGVFYRPVTPKASEFKARVNPQVRTTAREILTQRGLKLVDFRSREEYAGQQDTDGRPGHLPGAVHIDWRDLLGEGHRILAPEEKLRRLFAAVGVSPGDEVVAYCRIGMRAAIGYLVLQQLGYHVRLYDGSHAQWARSGLPVEEP